MADHPVTFTDDKGRVWTYHGPADTRHGTPIGMIVFCQEHRCYWTADPAPDEAEKAWKLICAALPCPHVPFHDKTVTIGGVEVDKGVYDEIAASPHGIGEFGSPWDDRFDQVRASVETRRELCVQLGSPGVGRPHLKGEYAETAQLAELLVEWYYRQSTISHIESTMVHPRRSSRYRDAVEEAALLRDEMSDMGMTPVLVDAWHRHVDEATEERRQSGDRSSWNTWIESLALNWAHEYLTGATVGPQTTGVDEDTDAAQEIDAILGAL